MEAPVTLDVATAHLAKEIREAADALLAKAGQKPEKWWRAYDLKDQTRNGWSAGALDIALSRLIDTGRFETRGDEVRLRS
jgi:hypothetical protein